MIRRLVVLVIACWLVTGAVPVLAHDGAEDVAWVSLSGSSQANGQATLRVDVAEQAVCGRLEPLRLEGVRAELDVSGTLERVEPCRFEGEIALPEPGRWAVTARFTYDNREAEVMMPVAVTDTLQTFERGDWLHAVGGADSGWNTTRTLLLAGLGLGVGAALTLAYRWYSVARGGIAVVDDNRRLRGG